MRAEWLRLVGAALLGGLVTYGWLVGPPVRDLLGRRVRDVDLPRERGILQRGGAPCPLTVTTGWRVERVEVEVDSRLVSGATARPLQPAGWGTFRGALPLAPGWNLVAARAFQGVHPTWTGTWQVGVGEVFLVAGQSNAVGASAQLFRASEHVRAGDLQPDGTLRWRSGDDPQSPFGGGSPWPELGRLIAAHTRTPVGFINVGQGGTHVGEWAVGTPLHTRLVRALEATRPHGVRAVLWQQGETSRSGIPEADDRDYHDTLAAVIADTHRVAGMPQAPWFVARVGHTGFAPHRGHRQAQERLWREGLALPGPDLDDLGAPWREADHVHFNGRGQVEVARRWFQALKRQGLLPEVKQAQQAPVATTDPNAAPPLQGTASP
ncbi:MAG: sialate O-acetylesterase [Candidatus Sericytochromatia bacterium]|nr:sialate O-acetylesterase [Candidatus Sericytochromatia bacterium]